ADEGLQLARETRQPIWDIGTRLLGGMIVALRGGNDSAQATAAVAEELAGGRRLTDLLACVQLLRGIGWIAVGRHAEAYRALSRLFDPDGTSFHLTERFHGLAFLAEAAVHAGHVDEARAVVAGLEAEARRTPSTALRVHLAYANAVLAPD